MNNTNLKTELMLLCDYALISKEGKVSAIGFFEEILNSAPSNVPAILAKGFVVATLTGTASTNYKLELRIEQGNKKENIIPKLEVDVNMGKNGRSNLVVGLEGISFPNPGIYNVRLYNNNEEVGSRELRVIKVKNNNQNSSTPN